MTSLPPTVSDFPRWNAVGARTLLWKEVRRFLRVPAQTVLQPLISTTLYFVVFGYGLGQRAPLEGVAPDLFVVPGLVFLALSTNAFLNSSSSVFIVKLQGTVVDLLVAPLGPGELLVGFVGGAMVRGMGVALLTWAVAALFTGAHEVHWPLTLLLLVLLAYLFSVLGFLAGLWAKSFEAISLFPSFLLMPLTFLGGVFYSVRDLPEPFRTISILNPVVHLVDDLRDAMCGRPVGFPVGLAVVVPLCLAVTVLAWRLLASGWRLKT